MIGNWNSGKNENVRGQEAVSSTGEADSTDAQPLQDGEKVVDSKRQAFRADVDVALEADPLEEKMKAFLERNKILPRFVRLMTRNYKEAHDFSSAELNVLKDHTFFLVDDDDLVLSILAGALMARAGDVDGYKFVGDRDKLDEMCAAIEKFSPDFVLMDYKMGGDMAGPDVVKVLRTRLPHVQWIGFSSLDVEDAFRSVGAIGSVEKNQNYPGETLVGLAKFLAKLKREE